MKIVNLSGIGMFFFGFGFGEIVNAQPPQQGIIWMALEGLFFIFALRRKGK